MNHKRLFPLVVLFLIAVAFFSSCDVDVIKPIPEPINLISNPSFESGGGPSLQSWWISDTLMTGVVVDSSSPSGTWSLRLFPGWIPGMFLARAYITGQAGTGVYKFSLAMKNTTRGTMWHPYGAIGRLVNSQLTNAAFVSTDSSQWTALSVFDTLSLQPRDTIAVELSGGACELCSGSTFFDNVSVQRVR